MAKLKEELKKTTELYQESLKLVMEQERRLDCSQFGFTEETRISAGLTERFERSKILVEDQLDQSLRRLKKIHRFNDQLNDRLDQHFKKHVAFLEDKRNWIADILSSKRCFKLGYSLPQPYEWPTKEWLRGQDQKTLEKLRFKKVEWTTNIGGPYGGQSGFLVALKFTLSDGSVSEQIGTRGALQRSYKFSDNEIVRSIKMARGYDNCV